jgi:hypothetical protein
MQPKWLTVVVAAVIVAACAATVGAAVYFLPQGHGVYERPVVVNGTLSGNCGAFYLKAYGMWCSQGFVVNGTHFNSTTCVSVFVWGAVVIGNPTILAVFLMNQTSYGSLESNSTLTYLFNASTSVGSGWCFGPIAVSSGPGAFYWAYVDIYPGNEDYLRVNYTVSVTTAS